MKAHFLLSLLPSFLLCSCTSMWTSCTRNMVGSSTINNQEMRLFEGEGASETRTIPLSAFVKIDFYAPVELQIVEGPQWKAELTGCPNQLDLIRTEVSDSQLSVKITDKSLYFGPDASVRVRVTMPGTDLENFRMKGIGACRILKPIRTNSLSVHADGVSDVAFCDLQAGWLNVQVGGIGNVIAKGTARRMEVGMWGMGAVRLEELRADTVSCDLSGLGSCTVYVNQCFSGSVSGIGSIEYDGNPANVSLRTSGLGSISRK